MKICPYCNYQLQDQTMICPRCGRPQPGGTIHPQMRPQYPSYPQYNNQQYPYQQPPYYGTPQYGNPQYGMVQQPVTANSSKRKEKISKQTILLIALFSSIIILAGVLGFAAIQEYFQETKTAKEQAEELRQLGMQGITYPSYTEEPVQNDDKQYTEFSEEKIISNINETSFDDFQQVNYVTFGSYEQDSNSSNGKEPIEWLVLDRQDNNALLISRFALDCRQYNNTLTAITWETSSLRSWLNNSFLNEAFSSEEQNKILTTQVNADKNPTFSTNPGNNTSDKIFIQSIIESNQYFPSDNARQVRATDYAIAKGAYLGVDGNAWCWLRSPGYDSEKAAGVMTSGGIDDFGDDVYGDVCGSIRPVLWVRE